MIESLPESMGDTGESGRISTHPKCHRDEGYQERDRLGAFSPNRADGTV